MRRRMMMNTKPAQDWDVVWDYTMGFPEDNGFEKLIDVSPEIKMTGDGLEITPFSGYVRYIPIGFETCNEGIFEETVTYNVFSNYNGNRMILCDGISGLQIFVLNAQIQFDNGMNNSQLIIANDLVLQKEYVIRIERIGGINKIFLDGDKIHETEVVSERFTSGNRIFFQGGGEYLLKSMKFKKIS